MLSPLYTLLGYYITPTFVAKEGSFLWYLSYFKAQTRLVCTYNSAPLTSAGWLLIRGSWDFRVIIPEDDHRLRSLQTCPYHAQWGFALQYYHVHSLSRLTNTCKVLKNEGNSIFLWMWILLELALCLPAEFYCCTWLPMSTLFWELSRYQDKAPNLK